MEHLPQPLGRANHRILEFMQGYSQLLQTDIEYDDDCGPLNERSDGVRVTLHFCNADAAKVMEGIHFWSFNPLVLFHWGRGSEPLGKYTEKSDIEATLDELDHLKARWLNASTNAEFSTLPSDYIELRLRVFNQRLPFRKHWGIKENRVEGQLDLVFPPLLMKFFGDVAREPWQSRNPTAKEKCFATIYREACDAIKDIEVTDGAPIGARWNYLEKKVAKLHQELRQLFPVDPRHVVEITKTCDVKIDNVVASSKYSKRVVLGMAAIVADLDNPLLDVRKWAELNGFADPIKQFPTYMERAKKRDLPKMNWSRGEGLKRIEGVFFDRVEPSKDEIEHYLKALARTY